MSPDLSPSNQAFDISLLNAEKLDSPAGLKTALGSIENICFQPGPAIAGMILTLDSRSHILEYVFSVLNEKAYEKLSRWVILEFPTPTTPNATENLSVKLLQRLSASLLFAEYPSDADAPKDLHEFWKKVELLSKSLQDLEGSSNASQKGYALPPTNRKRGKTLTGSARVDPGALGIDIPTTEAETQVVRARILSELRGILEYYLLVLRQPLLSEIFKASYMRVYLARESVIKEEAPPPETETEITTPDQPPRPAFPVIQPMKASLYFDGVEGFGEWAVNLSTRALKDLRDVKRSDGAMFRIVIKKIKELSQGHFSADNQKRLTGAVTKLPIYEAKMTNDTRLVYHIDCIPDQNRERQAIRIFGVFTHAQLEHGGLWDTLSHQLQQVGLQYVERCNYRTKPVSPGDDVIFPATFPPLPVQDTAPVDPLIKVSEEDIKKIHSMHILEKFVAFSQALLNSILVDKEVSHVFLVSDQEQEIIEHCSSCYVIGRSGTGKTTTMLFKMLGIERTWKQYPDMGPRPRQVFVTQSRVLATKVEEYFAQLMGSLEAAAYSQDHLRAIKQELNRRARLVDQDDNEQWRSDLPDKFSKLSEEHFPLFITYDRLCTMLQNDIEDRSDNDVFVVPKTPATEDTIFSPRTPKSPAKSRFRAGSSSGSTSDYMQQLRRNFVSYPQFLASYWAHLPQTFTRSLDPALVFGEIMGVIKGSEEAVGMKERCLDRETYRALSFRTQGTFAHKRDEIYNLFMAYTNLKVQRQDYDAADRSHYILGELRNAGLKGRKVDFLYIDEVQDNLLIDTLILRTLCSNQHGLFWAGDTAQTIAVGSSFKFTGLKSYQYRIEEQLSQVSGLTPIEPRTFELALNYRSHSGIVNCARSVIELVMGYWPYSIDPLKPERGRFDGPKPTFYSDQGDTAFERSLFCTGKGAPVEFGAKQCILVRDEAAKEELQKRLGRSIIMTLYDSKGLEFNDVLLYNFFEDSKATLSQWRLVLNEVERKDRTCEAPVFDETRHASICSELKFLYVAITRAKKNLWIMDTSDKAEPMKMYWESKEQIKISSSTSEIAGLATSSTNEEWIRTGEYMFFSKRYAQASVAFQNAKRPREAAVCNAYHLREKARSQPTTPGSQKEKAFIEAAVAFNGCAQAAPPKLGEEKRAYYKNAGQCFSEGRKLDEAGKCYVKAKEYTLAANAFRKGGHFDEMVEVLQLHRDSIDNKDVRRLTQVARMFYFKAGGVLNCEKGMRLFSSDEDALDFLEEYDLDEARATILQSRGKALEAAEAHAKEGRVLEAVGVLLERDDPTVEESRMAIRYVLAGLWKRLSFGIRFRRSDTTTTSLLQISSRLDSSLMTEEEMDELSMFKSIAAYGQEVPDDTDATDIVDPDLVQLRRLAFKFNLGRANKAVALVCLDHLFYRAPSFQKATLMETESLLSRYLTYVRLLDQLWRDNEFSEGSNSQKIFAYEIQQEDRYLVPSNTFLHGRVSAARGILSDPPSEYVCSREELGRIISSGILRHIKIRVKIQENACRGTRGFSPCLYIFFGRNCYNESCQFQHTPPNEITLDWFHARLRFLFLEFQILRLAQLFDKTVMKYWLQMFYLALCPPIRKLGSINSLDLRKIPDGEQNMHIVREWTWYACNDLNMTTPPPFPVHNMTTPPPFPVYNMHFIPDFMTTCTLVHDLDFANALVKIPETGVYRSRERPPCLVRDGGYFIVRDFLMFLRYESPWSLRFGYHFMRHVLSNHLRLDLDTFCDLAERLCALFIVERRVQYSGRLTNVTLPRSWVTHISRAFFAEGKRTGEMKPFLHACVELVKRISLSGEGAGEHLRASGVRLNPFTSTVYVARMCSCLCILGFNIEDRQLRSDIVVAFQQLQKGDWRSTPMLYRDYAWVRDWSELVQVFRKSFADSAMDELILLIHSKGSWPFGWKASFARLVVYDRLEDILSGVAFRTSKQVGEPTLPHPGQPMAVAVSNQIHANHDGTHEQDDPLENVADDHEQELESQEDHELQTPELQAKNDAARKIQTACTRHLERKKAVPTGVHAVRARFWSQLQARAAGMTWNHPSRYKLILQGPMVHVLVCLDLLGAAADSAKREVKKRAKFAHHEELEELMDSQKRYSGFLKSIINLQKKLGPPSDLHERRDLQALKAAVLEVQKVIEIVANDSSFIATTKQIGQDWGYGRKGILQETVHRKVLKPKLVIDPEDRMFPGL